MSDHGNSVWYHNNRYNAQGACSHCGGVVRHETWCITRDPLVRYAWQIVRDSTKLTPGDYLALHSLGVCW